MINKGCEVNYSFQNGFILGEEQLQTLSSKIKERYPKEELIYKITKGDSYVFQTLDINEIFKEENSNGNFIKKLDMIMNNDDIINFDLCFEKGEDTSLKIIGDNKDRIYLLYNEIKTYVENEVTTVKTFLKYDILKGVCFLVSILLMVGCMLFMMSSLFHSRVEKVRDVLDSSDLAIKLNYLIEQQVNTSKDAEEYMYFFIPISVIAVFLVVIPVLMKFLWGKNGVLRITDYFLFGKQKNIYDKKVKVKNNIIWSVGVGLVISIFGGFAVYFVTK